MSASYMLLFFKKPKSVVVTKIAVILKLEVLFVKKYVDKVKTNGDYGSILNEKFNLLFNHIDSA